MLLPASALQTFIRMPRRVTVRPMTARDAAAVAQIWKDGLQQTADASPWWIRSKMADGMQKYGESALKEDGDVGPDGGNLIPKWNDPPAKLTRRMFVAVLDDNNENKKDERVVGAVGVRKGYEEKEEHDPDCKLASIWRMSVDASVRRQGVGTALMGAAEDWARENKCTRMKLVTANPVAGKFYVDKAGYERQPKETSSWWWWWWQHIPQPWRSVHQAIHDQIHFYEKEL